MKNLNKIFVAVGVGVVVCGTAYVCNDIKTINKASAMYEAYLNNDKAAFIEAYKNADKRAVARFTEWVTADKEQQAADISAAKYDAKKTAEALKLFNK